MPFSNNHITGAPISRKSDLKKKEKEAAGERTSRIILNRRSREGTGGNGVTLFRKLIERGTLKLKGDARRQGRQG